MDREDIILEVAAEVWREERRIAPREIKRRLEARGVYGVRTHEIMKAVEDHIRRLPGELTEKAGETEE